MLFQLCSSANPKDIQSMVIKEHEPYQLYTAGRRQPLAHSTDGYSSSFFKRIAESSGSNSRESHSSNLVPLSQFQCVLMTLGQQPVCRLIDTIQQLSSSTFDYNKQTHLPSVTSTPRHTLAAGLF